MHVALKSINFFTYVKQKKKLSLTTKKMKNTFTSIFKL